MLYIILDMKPVDGADDGHERHDKGKDHRQIIHPAEGESPVAHEGHDTVCTRVPVEIEHIEKGYKRYHAQVDLPERLFHQRQQQGADYQYQRWVDEISLHSNPLGS
ncbi:MAG: hypothetical protein ACD_75C00623G0003 [uncultured bacterium]|nr:MAG: hypothetical protein ACD_75C00623G0003 [uncultured bacterium]